MYVMIIAQQDKALNSVIVDNTFRSKANDNYIS